MSDSPPSIAIGAGFNIGGYPFGGTDPISSASTGGNKVGADGLVRLTVPVPGPFDMVFGARASVDSISWSPPMGRGSLGSGNAGTIGFEAGLALPLALKSLEDRRQAAPLTLRLLANGSYTGDYRQTQHDPVYGFGSDVNQTVQSLSLSLHPEIAIGIPGTRVEVSVFGGPVWSHAISASPIYSNSYSPSGPRPSKNQPIDALGNPTNPNSFNADMGVQVTYRFSL